MPLAPRYTWSETEESVQIQLHGVSIKDPSQLLCGDAVVKITAAPYFLLLDLHGEVDARAGVATVHGNSMQLTLRKREAGLWGRLTAVGDKAAIATRREASIQRAHEQQAADAAARAKRKQQEERDAIDRRIELDRQQRDAIEARRKQELDAERRRLEEWQGSLAEGKTGVSAALLPSHPAAEQGDESDYEEELLAAEDQEVGGTPDEPGPKQKEATAEAAAAHSDRAPQSDHPDYYGRGWRPTRDQEAGSAAKQRSSPATGMFGSGSDTASSRCGRPAGVEVTCGDSETGQGNSKEARPEDQAQIGLCPPLARGALQPVAVTFTPLEAPHLPARQQREAELRLHKRGAAASQAADSIDLADRQPAFLKDKGDALFHQGNPSGAAAAYTRALALVPRDPAPLLANRAACHAQLGNHAQVVADCSAALEVLRTSAQAAAAVQGPLNGSSSGESSDKPVLEGDAVRMAVKLLVRRAAARVELGDLGAAEADLSEALRYDPANTRVAADLAEVQAAIELAANHSTNAATVPNGDLTQQAGSNRSVEANHSSSDTDPGLLEEAVRARGEARFRTGDYEGAAEAFGALVLLYQQQAVRHQDAACSSNSDNSDAWATEGAGAVAVALAMARALGNRAACWLPLERYSDCIGDCGAALAMLSQIIDGATGSSSSTAVGACSAAELAVTHSQNSALERSTGATTATVTADSALQAAQALLVAAQKAAAAAAASAAPNGVSPSSTQGNASTEQTLSFSAGCWQQHVSSAARLAARAALASACAKHGIAAGQLFELARALHCIVGEDAAANPLRVDEARLLGAATGDCV